MRNAGLKQTVQKRNLTLITCTNLHAPLLRLIHSCTLSAITTTGGFLDPEDYEFLEHNNATGKTSGCQERDIVLTGRPKFNNIGPVQCAFQCVNTKECVYFVHTELGCSLR